jgi:hypothetical protein
MSIHKYSILPFLHHFRFKLWSYDGNLIHHQPVKDELYEVKFKPVPRHLLSKLAPPLKAAAVTTTEPVKESPKPTGKYIPPHATSSSFMKVIY